MLDIFFFFRLFIKLPFSFSKSCFFIRSVLHICFVEYLKSYTLKSVVYFIRLLILEILYSQPVVYFSISFYFYYVVLCIDVMVTRFGDVVEARTVQCSSLQCLVHPYELIFSKGIRCSFYLC